MPSFFGVSVTVGGLPGRCGSVPDAFGFAFRISKRGFYEGATRVLVEPY